MSTSRIRGLFVFTYFFAIAWLVCAAVTGVALWAGSHINFSPTIGIWVDGVVVGLFTFLFLILPNTVASTINDIAKGFPRAFAAVLLPGTLWYLAIVVVTAGQFFRYWNAAHGGFMTPPNADFSNWTYYSLGWVLDNLLANFGQIFGWDLSTIHPIHQDSRIVVFIYNVLLETIVIRAIFGLATVVVRGRTTSASQAMPNEE